MIFYGLTSGFEILKQINLIFLKNISQQLNIYDNEKMQTENDLCLSLLKMDENFFFNNILAIIKSLNFETNKIEGEEYKNKNAKQL